MSNYSILRTHEDTMLARLNLTGRVIDLGGHKSSSYFSLLKTKNPVEVVNLDSTQDGVHKTSSKADYVFDLENLFPLESESFDNILCINVMEHIYNYNNLLAESFRILKRGGATYFSVPFFFNVHSSPNDYFRYTRSALVRIFEEHGFTDVVVTELGEGPCSAVFQAFGGSIPTTFLRMFFKRTAMFVDRTLSKFSTRYASIKYRVPLGYFIVARKHGLRTVL